MIFNGHTLIDPDPDSRLLRSSCILFIFGGFGMLRLLIETALNTFGLTSVNVETEQGVIIFEVVEVVPTSIVSTVLYLTAMGLFQLFIMESEIPQKGRKQAGPVIPASNEGSEMKPSNPVCL